MRTNQHHLFPVRERADIFPVISSVRKFTAYLDMPKKGLDRVELVLSELGTNLVKYAKEQPHLLVRIFEAEGASGLEVLSIDKGPGIGRVSHYLQDGASTSTSLGIGLGAIQRNCDEFEINSIPGRGTAILCRFHDQRSNKKRERVGTILVGKKGHSHCGDGYSIREGEPGQLWLLGVDGLGHGAKAEEVALKAQQKFESAEWSPADDTIREIDTVLRGTRGVVASVVDWNPEKGDLRYAGVGNLGCRILKGRNSRTLINRNGIVGYNLPSQLLVLDEQLHNDDWVVIWSDGIRSRWSMEGVEGRATISPQLMAAILYRDFSKGIDDNLVMVFKQSTP